MSAELKPKNAQLSVVKEAPNMPHGFFFNSDGLCYDGGENEPYWISVRVEVLSITQSRDGKNWGREIQFRDPANKKKKIVIPMALFAGRGETLYAILLSEGLIMNSSPKAKAYLSMYIQQCTKRPIKLCVDRIGWFEGCYVLPHRVIGDTNDRDIVFQPERIREMGFIQKGTLEQWRENVARYAVGNSRILLALSASLSAPLFSLLKLEGGGFHFRGGSGIGKTTTAYMSTSVWGDHRRKTTWRATVNGLELTAFEHNDSLLVLDEMGEIASRDIGSAVYMLANGQGKQRANEYNPKTWRLLFVSTGEIGIKSAMLEAGQVVKAGQEVRLIDIEADTGKHGIFEQLHGMEAGFLSQTLQSNTNDYCGTAGIPFIEEFIRAKDENIAFVKEMQARFVKQYKPKECNTVTGRVLQRFGAVAGGGELATKMGITGWNKDEAFKGVGVCFLSWLETQGNYSKPKEYTNALEHIRAFIESHGESRFVDMNIDAGNRSDKPNRVGYRKLVDGEMRYYFLPTVFKNDVCKGHSLKTVLNALKSEGVLIHDTNKNQTPTPFSTDGGRRQKVYCVSNSILDG